MKALAPLAFGFGALALAISLGFCRPPTGPESGSAPALESSDVRADWERPPLLEVEFERELEGRVAPNLPASGEPDMAQGEPERAAVDRGSLMERPGVPRPAWTTVQVEVLDPASELVQLDGAIAVVHWEHGVIAEMGETRAGRRHGYWEYYDEEGRLEASVEYAYGVAEGRCMKWFPDGSPALRGWAREGRFHGWCEFFEPDGTSDTGRSGEYRNGVRLQPLERSPSEDEDRGGN